MTRFDATTPGDRQSLFAAGIRAHRERGSPFVTVEAEPGSGMAVAPWVQFAAPEGILNTDCRDAELEAVRDAVEGFGGATVREQRSPQGAQGTNLRIEVRGDPERVAMLIERVFREGFGLPAGYRAWVAEI